MVAKGDISHLPPFLPSVYSNYLRSMMPSTISIERNHIFFLNLSWINSSTLGRIVLFCHFHISDEMNNYHRHIRILGMKPPGVGTDGATHTITRPHVLIHHPYSYPPTRITFPIPATRQGKRVPANKNTHVCNPSTWATHSHDRVNGYPNSIFTHGVRG